MSGKMKVLVLFASAAVAVSCAGYDPEDAVTIRYEAPPSLNTYGGTAHALDLYIFKVSDPLSFQSNELVKLQVENQAVSGGQGTARQTVTPGTKGKLHVGPMIYEAFTHIGVVAAYREPMGNQVLTREIPSDAKLKLVLGPNGILALTDD